LQINVQKICIQNPCIIANIVYNRFDVLKINRAAVNWQMQGREASSYFLGELFSFFPVATRGSAAFCSRFQAVFSN
jgi:hypothetical protein